MTQFESLITLLHKLDKLHVKAYSLDEFGTMRKLDQQIHNLPTIAYYVLGSDDYQLFTQEFNSLTESREELV